MVHLMKDINLDKVEIIEAINLNLGLIMVINL